MSFNIVDLVKDQISDQILGQMGGLLGDQSSKAEAGVANAIPALLSGITNRAGVPGGADSLFGAVQDQDDGLLDNLGAMLGGSQSSSMIEQGSSMLGNLFGNSGLGSLAGVVSGLTGLSKGNTGSLMGMLAPIIFSVLKRKVLGGGLNAGGLLDMLKGQNDNINAAMPVGLSDQLNSSGFLSSITNVGGIAAGAAGSVSDAAGNAIDSARGVAGNVADGVSNVAGGAVDSVRDGAGAVTGAAGNAAANAASGGSSIFKKLIPLIAIALLGFLGYKMFGGAGKEAVDGAATAVTDTASNVASTTTEAASNAVATATETASETASNVADAAADAVDFDVSQAGNDLTSMFGDAKSSLEGITDLDSAKSAVPGLTEMGDKFNGIADKIPEGAGGAIGPIISKGLEMLEPVLEKVRAIPGVGALIDPVLGPMIEKMQEMAG